MTYYRFPNGEVYDLNHEPGQGAVKLSAKAGKLARSEYCAAQLRGMVNPGDTVYTVLRKPWNDSRIVCSVVVIKDNRPVTLNSLAADVLGYRTTENGEIIVRGGGMDLGFHLVYSLSRRLYADGEVRQSNGSTSGGYVLRHEWL